MKITLDAAAKSPIFRFEGRADEPARVLQIRITKVGASEPSWLLGPIGSFMQEMAAVHILTPEEAERADQLGSFDFNGELGAAVDAFGVPVTAVTYGVIPDGFKQEGPLRHLEPNRLYQLLAMGTTLGELEFYG
jgi:hypothetical protein